MLEPPGAPPGASLPERPIVLSQGICVRASPLAGVVFFSILLAVVSACEQTFLSLTEAQIRRLEGPGERARGTGHRVRAPAAPGNRDDRSLERRLHGRRDPELPVAHLGPRNRSRCPRARSFGGLLAGLVLAIFGRAVPRAVVSAHGRRMSAFHLVRIYSVVDAFFMTPHLGRQPAARPRLRRGARTISSPPRSTRRSPRRTRTRPVCRTRNASSSTPSSSSATRRRRK